VIIVSRISFASFVAIFVSLAPRARERGRERERERENETEICDIVLLGPNYCLARTFLGDATRRLR